MSLPAGNVGKRAGTLNKELAKLRIRGKPFKGRLVNRFKVPQMPGKKPWLGTKAVLAQVYKLLWALTQMHKHLWGFWGCKHPCLQEKHAPNMAPALFWLANSLQKDVDFELWASGIPWHWTWHLRAMLCFVDDARCSLATRQTHTEQYFSLWPWSERLLCLLA